MPDPNPKALLAVRYSHLALGKPYVYGGTSYKTGVDCSGLIYTAYMLGAHVTIPRTSETQWQAPSFRPVKLHDVIPGDLIFGNEGEQIAGLPGHVILGIGGGKAICAQHTGTTVVIMDITDAFTAGSIMGAKRPLPAVGEGPYQGGQVIGAAGDTSSGSGGSGGSSSFAFVGDIKDGLASLVDPHTWYRVGQVLIGAIAVIAGILLFVRSNPVGKQLENTAAIAAVV